MVTNQRSFGLLILLVNTLGNVLGTVWRICILILGYKGLREHDGLERRLLFRVSKLIAYSSLFVYFLSFSFRFVEL